MHTCFPDKFPPTFVVWGNTRRTPDLLEGILLYTKGDVDLLVILVDFIKKRI
jgi:hypothetical protein